MRTQHIPMAVALIGTAVLTPVRVMSQQSDSYWYEHDMTGWGQGWFHMILGPIFMILVLAFVIVIMVFFVRWIVRPSQNTHSQHRPSALDILKERYARGEIDKDEYEERLRVIGN